MAWKLKSGRDRARPTAQGQNLANHGQGDKFGQEITPVLSGTTWPEQVAQYDRYILLI